MLARPRPSDESGDRAALNMIVPNPCIQSTIKVAHVNGHFPGKDDPAGSETRTA